MNGKGVPARDKIVLADGSYNERDASLKERPSKIDTPHQQKTTSSKRATRTDT